MLEKILRGINQKDPHPPTKARRLLLLPNFGGSLLTIFRLQQGILIPNVFLEGEVLEVCSKVGLMKVRIVKKLLQQAFQLQ